MLDCYKLTNGQISLLKLRLHEIGYAFLEYAYSIYETIDEQHKKQALITQNLLFREG